MRTPAMAVLWESWRLTRGRLLFVPTLAGTCGWLLSRGAMSPLAFVVLLSAAVAMAMSLPLFGTARAFPLSKAFARPISTLMLVGVPLAYVSVAAAACYFVPASILRLLTGLQLPVVAPSALIGALAVLVAGCTWFTRVALVRAGLGAAGFVLASVMLQWLHPFGEAGSFPLKLGPRSCVLSGMGYLLLAFFAAGIYVWIVVGVWQQRHGDQELSLPRTSADMPRQNGADIMLWVRRACVDLLRWRCPVSSPTVAELWFEMECYGLAVLAIGVLMALVVPLLMYWANAVRSAIPLVLAACTLLAPFVAGVGASIWNRRNTARAQVSAFEAARPIATRKLIGLQVLVTSLCISGAWILVLTSAWISLPLIKNFHDYGSPSRLALDLIQHYGLRLAAVVVIFFVLFTSLLAFLAAVRAFASAYGWRFWLGISLAVLYLVGVLIAAARELVDGAVLGAHIWALAVAILVGTLFALERAVACGALKLRHVATASLAWVPFAVLYLDTLRTNGVTHASAALEAVAVASALLPLLATGLAPWSLGSIRHA